MVEQYSSQLTFGKDLNLTQILIKQIHVSWEIRILARLFLLDLVIVVLEIMEI